MSPLELAVVQRKLNHLEELLELLRGESTTPLTNYLQDRRQQLLVERLLHLSVEATSDLLEHLLMQELNCKPQTYADTFFLAGQHGLIPMELAQRLIPAAGLRNRLVPVTFRKGVTPRLPFRRPELTVTPGSDWAPRLAC